MRMNVAPEHGEERILVDGVLNRPGAAPENVKPGVSDQDVIDYGGVRDEERKHREPPVAVEDEVAKSVERDDREAKHRRQGKVERHCRRRTGHKPERPVHPVTHVVVDVEPPPGIPGIKRRDDWLAHDRGQDGVVHKLLAGGDGRVDPAHLEHEEEGDQEGDIPFERRIQSFLCVESA